MALISGWACDVCGSTRQGRQDKPEEWFVVRPPYTAADAGVDNSKDICSATCLGKYARLIKKSAATDKLSGTAIGQLDQAGVAVAQRGAVVQAHKLHYLVPDDACPLCVPS